MNELRRVDGFTQGPTSSGLMTWYAAVLDCGHKWYEKPTTWEPISTVGVGDSVECEQCRQLAKEEDWLRNLDYSQVHHARFNPRFGGQYHYYRRDVTSPSGFLLIGSTAATPRIDALLRTKTNCGPLSPTERS